MTQWISLYLPSADTERIKAALDTLLSAPPYERYDPFGLLPGKAYEKALKCFIAPPVSTAQGSEWSRLIFDALSESAAAPDDRLKAALSEVALCMSVHLKGDEAVFAAYENGEPVDFESALASYVSEGALNAALNLNASAQGDMTMKGVPGSVLPDDLQAQAGQLKPKQIDRLMNQMSRRFLSSDQQDAAASMIQGQVVNWSSAGGQRIAALMDALGIPDWREPDYVTLRDAYQQHIRRQRNPKARIYPGDQEAMDAVPDALDYVPVFAGVLSS